MLDGLHRHLRAVTRPDVAGDVPALLRSAGRAARAAVDADHSVVCVQGDPAHLPRGRLYLVDGEGFLDVDVPPRLAARAGGVLAERDLDVPGLASPAPHALVVPLGDGTPGTLVLTRATAFSADEEEAAGVLGLSLGLAVQSALLTVSERTAAGRASRGALLERVTGLLQTSATTAEITERIPPAVVEVLDCLSSSLYVVDGDELVGRRTPRCPNPSARGCSGSTARRTPP